MKDKTMKDKRFDLLLAPNLWVGICSVLAVGGIVCLILGRKTLGLWLVAPLLIGGVILTIVVIPIVIRANRKHRKSDKGNTFGD